jgi:hypothetical protein
MTLKPQPDASFCVGGNEAKIRPSFMLRYLNTPWQFNECAALSFYEKKKV